MTVQNNLILLLSLSSFPYRTQECRKYDELLTLLPRYQLGNPNTSAPQSSSPTPSPAHSPATITILPVGHMTQAPTGKDIMAFLGDLRHITNLVLHKFSEG